VEARIEEPSQTDVLWSLGHVSTLGYTTMLAQRICRGGYSVCLGRLTGRT